MIGSDSSQPALSEDEALDGLTEPRFDHAGGERYERRGLLGVGGMGRVYAAQDRHLRRDVAIKVASTPELTARLAREALITAQLEHPGIVAVYDAGHNADGRPWYTMRLIRGRTLQEQLQRCTGLDDRLGLLGHFQDACQAVAYAHNMGIVHRDLKPANIMVGEFGETQVADWGLARPVDSAVESWDRILTTSAATGVAGTPRYMSPEQARGESSGCGADVWGLGVVLYEMLSGDKAPEAPGVPPPLERLDGQVPASLVAVARHCLALDPAERYPDAAALAADFGRYLDGRRVHVHDYTPRELLGRLVRAWRAPLGVAALAILALGAVLAVGAQQTRVERHTAERNLARALSQQALAALAADHHAEAAVLAAHSLALGPSALARGVLAATPGPWPERLVSLPLPQACQDEPYLSPDGSRVLCPSGDRLSLWNLAPLTRVWDVPVHLDRPPVWSGDAVVAPSVDDAIRWLRQSDGVEIARRDVLAPPTLMTGSPGLVWAVAGPFVEVLSGDGELQAQFSICEAPRSALAAEGDLLLAGCEDGQLRIYGLSGQLLGQLASPAGGYDWSHIVLEGDQVFAGTRQGTVHRRSLATGEWVSLASGVEGGVLQVAPVQDSTLVLVRGERGGTRIWDTESNAWVGALPSRVQRVFEGRSGHRVVVQGEGIETWQLPETLRPGVVALGPGVAQVTVSPDGEQVGYALGSGLVGLMGAADRKIVQTWQWQDGVAKCLTFLDDGRLFGAGMSAMGGRILSPGGEISVGVDLASTYFRRVGTLADGSLWALAYGRFSVRMDARAEQVLGGLDQAVYFDGSSSPGRTYAAFVDTLGGVWRYDGQHVARVAHSPDVFAIDVDDQGRLLTAERHRLCFMERCHPIDGRVLDIAMAPSGERVAVALLSGDIVVMDPVGGQVEAVLRGHTKRVSSVEWGPQGRWLVSGSWDGTLRFWDLAALDADPLELIRTLESAWGLGLDEALGG